MNNYAAYAAQSISDRKVNLKLFDQIDLISPIFPFLNKDIPTINYISVGSKKESFASHLLTRGSSFERILLPASNLEIDWRLKVNIQGEADFALSGLALLSNGNFCQGTRDALICVSPVNGSVMWSIPHESAIDYVFVIDNNIFTGCRDGRLINRSAQDGSPIWDIHVADDWISGINNIGSDAIVFGSRDGKIRCISKEDGFMRWVCDLGARIFAQPCVDEDLIFVGARNGFLFVLDAAEGRIITKIETGSDVHGTTTIAGDKILFGSDDKRLYCLDRSSFNVNWMFRTGDAVWSKPVVLGSKVIFGSTDSYAYCLDLQNGKTLWERGTTEAIRLGIAATNKYVCIANERGYVLLLDIETGELLAKTVVSGAIWSAPLVIEDRFIVVTRGNEIVSIPTHW